MRIRVVLAVSLLLAACGGISFENQNAVEGTYTLRSVNGQPLPLALNDRPVQFTVASGTLTLTASGAWSEVLTGTSIENGQTVSRQLTEGGSWTLQHPHVELVRADGYLTYFGDFSVLSGPKLDLQRPVYSTVARYIYAR